MKQFIKPLAAVLSVVLFSLFLFGCDSRVEELSGAMTAEEIAQLDRYKNLKKLDLSGSECYAEIEDYIAGHPEVAVRYTVKVDGREYDPQVTELSLSSPDAIDELLEKLPYLHRLSAVTVNGGAISAEQLSALQKAMPKAQLQYSVSLLGEDFPSSTESLDLSGITQAQAVQAAQALPMLPALSQITLSDELPLDAFIALKSAAPQAEFRYGFDLFGQQVNTRTESLAYSRTEIGNEGAELFMRLLPCLDRLQRLSFEYCDIDDAVMAEMRDAFPDKEIVWRVVYGWGSSWSDTETIWAIGGFGNDTLKPLKYCTKVKYLDLGHNGLTDIDFIYSMPDLEVFILENDDIEDITAIGSCKNLEYLEVGETNVHDISPLANCTNLVHLNIGGLHKLTDISPLYGLTKLERLYGICSENVPQEQIDHMRELLPDCDIHFEYDPKGPVGGANWRYASGGGLVPRYQLLHDQLGYDW